MHYDVEADWMLLGTCNYRCVYCFYPERVLAGKLRVFAEPEKWGAAFDATALTWLLHITGGEPTIYPRFTDLCVRLSASHYLSLNSNLTHASIRSFAERVDPRRVSFVNASLHAEERDCRQGLTTFLANLAVLQDHDFPVYVSVVATPDVLANFDAVTQLLRPVGLVPVPKVLRGPFEGRLFPRGYTDEERKRFRAVSAVARTAYHPMLARMPEPPTIDPFADDDVLEGVPSYKGRLCGAGQKFVRIDPDGGVVRCGRGPLGNVLRGTLALRPQPAPCDTSYCFYFCRKYAAPAGDTAHPQLTSTV